MDIRKRFQMVELLQEAYPDFPAFAADGMAFLGFDLTWMQEDIAEYMQSGPRLRMVMAQRGEAKTTLAALYAVWRIIHDPRTRVLIVSAGEQNSSDTATLIVRLFLTWDILECLRPDKAAGDRTSTTSFDVHYALKGLDRSPSIACAGITSNLPGRRADLLIPDDIESTKNGLTVVQRQLLLQLSKEFSSICTHGDILYLGTPQSKDSIYNSLPGRGFDIRIWPGRYPTQEELEKYGDRLAHSIAQRLAADPALGTGGGLDGTRGQPADVGRYTEADLIEKELDKGPDDFALQHMLDTSLVDAARQQLKLSNLLVANFDCDAVPEFIVYQAAQKYEVDLPATFPVPMSRLYHPVPVECAFLKPQHRFMFIDPAGGGTDELAYAISSAVGPFVHVLDVGGLKGGLEGDNPQKLIDIIREFNVTEILCESNMGHGLFEINLRAELEKAGIRGVGVSGEYSVGQKETRIINRLVSASQRHKIVLHKRVFESDELYGKQHSADKRNMYSVFFQFANITPERNSLVHDDRLEAMAGAVWRWRDIMATDENKASAARKQQDLLDFLKNPMDYPGEAQRARPNTRARVSGRRR